MPWLIDTVEAQLLALADQAGVNGSVRRWLSPLLHLLCRESLGRPTAEHYAGLSHVNANGLPFQWVLGSEGHTVRFLCECGIPGNDTASRLALSLERLAAICDLTGMPWPTWLKSSVLDVALPERGIVPTHWESALWIGVGVGAGGLCLKVYVNLDHGLPRERWLRIGRILLALGRRDALQQLCALSGLVSAGSRPVGLCVDVQRNAAPGRLKAYFASEEVTIAWLSAWYGALDAAKDMPALVAFLGDCGLPCAEFPPKGLFVSLEFDVREQVTLKTDVPVCRWLVADAVVVAAVRRLADRFDLSLDGYLAGLDAIGASSMVGQRSRLHQLVGLGFESDGSHHVNVYCEPGVSGPR